MKTISMARKGDMLLWAWLWLWLCIILAILFRNQGSKEFTLFTFTSTFSYILCVYSWIKTGNRVVSLYLFFVVYSFFCSCSQGILYVAGLPEWMLSAFRFSTFQYLVDAMRFQTICIAGLNLGAMLYVKPSKHRVSMLEQSIWYQNLDIHRNKYDNILFVLMVICFMGSLLYARSIAVLRSTMTYDEYAHGGNADLGNMFYFTYFYLFLSLRFVFKKQYVLMIYSSWLLLTLSFFALGVRTQGMPYISCFVITFPMTHPHFFKRKYIIPWIVAGVAGFILLGLVSATRDNLGTNLSEGSQGMYLDLLNTVNDVGELLQSTALTIEVVDHGTPHFQSILRFVLMTIPENVLKIPSDVLDSIWNIGIKESLGGYVTTYAGSYSGLGYSFISEAYMNYGWLGFIYVILYGYIIAFLENDAYLGIMKGNYFKITFLLILCKQIFYARGELQFCNVYVEYMIFTYILYRLFGKRNQIQKQAVVV